MSSQSFDGLWDIRSAARYLHMSEAFMRKAVRQKSIPFSRIGGKTLRFAKKDLDAWIAARTQGPGYTSVEGR